MIEGGGGGEGGGEVGGVGGGGSLEGGAVRQEISELEGRVGDHGLGHVCLLVEN